MSRELASLIRAAAFAAIIAAGGMPVAGTAQTATGGLAASIIGIKPSVVVVGSYRELNSPRFGMRGSGFVVSDGNTVATNAHVVQGATEEEPGTSLAIVVHPGQADAQMRRATLIDLDKAHDIALLRFEGLPLKALPLGDSEAAAEGQAIAFMGFPIGGALGFSPVTHRGIISSITPIVLPAPGSGQLDSGAITRIREGPFRIFQLDGTAYPGSSGGPLFDVDTGQVIGLVNMTAIKGTKESALTHPSGISYAVPVRFLSQLLNKNRTR